MECGLSETSGWKRNVTHAVKFANIEVIECGKCMAIDVTDASKIREDRCDACDKIRESMRRMQKKREDRSEGCCKFSGGQDGDTKASLSTRALRQVLGPSRRKRHEDKIEENGEGSSMRVEGDATLGVCSRRQEM